MISGKPIQTGGWGGGGGGLVWVLVLNKCVLRAYILVRRVRR